MKSKGRPTIFDLEKATGYSRGTISRAFNERPEVSASAREFILRKAAEIGYAPHPGARSMTMGKSGRWGLLIPQLQNPYYAELMEAVDREARQRNTIVLLGLSHNDRALETELINYWASGEADGMIISASPPQIEPKLLERLIQRDFPVVFLYDRPSDQFDLVGVDARGSLDRAMRHLLEFGHRRIAYLGQESPLAHLSSTYMAYESVYKRGILEFDERLVYLGPYDSKAGTDAWKKWRALDDPPTAVVCYNDIMACWIMHAARVDGVQIPRDLSIIGNDDTAEAVRTGLTTIRANPTLLAREIFNLLDDPRKPGEMGRLRWIPSDFIMRDTVAAPRTGTLPG